MVDVMIEIINGLKMKTKSNVLIKILKNYIKLSHFKIKKSLSNF